MGESEELSALADLLSSTMKKVSEVPVEYRGTIVAIGRPGRVIVDIGGSLRDCLDLPSYSAISDSVITVTTGNDCVVTKNLTREKNPPTTSASPSAYTKPALAYPKGFTDAGYSNSEFTAQDFQVGLYAEYLKGYIVEHSYHIDEIGTKLSSLITAVQSIQQALKSQGVIQ